jgi:hypothetical protein
MPGTMLKTSKDLLDDTVRRCIDECVRCHEVCLSTVPYSLDQGGAHAGRAHITLLLDCANMCQTSADFMLRGSEEHARTCAVCAAICRRCADDCDRFTGDDVMHACAETCRRCAESCEQMAHAHM